MNKRNIEFYLEYRGSRVKVTPYYKKLEKKTAKEAGQEYYRETLNGQIKFIGDDFDLINAEPITTEFTFIVKVFKAGSWLDYYKGTFTKVNCKLDLAKRMAEPKFKTDDLYKKVLDKYKDEFDIVKLGIPTERISCVKRPFVQIYCAGASSVTNIHNGKSWEADTSVAIELSRTQDGMVELSSKMSAMGFSNLANRREVYIEGASITDVNGMYTETEYLVDLENHLSGRRWYKVKNNTRSYYIEAVRNNANLDLSYARLYKYGTDELLYEAQLKKSELPEDVFWAFFEAYGSLKNLVFSRYGGAGFAIVTKDFVYSAWGRVMHNSNADGVAVKIDDFAASNASFKYASPLSSIVVAQSPDSAIEKTEYGVNDEGGYFTDKWLPALFPTGRYVPICRSSWVNSSLWLAYEKTKFDDIDNTYSAGYILRDAYSVGSIIKAILAQIDTTLSHEATAEFSKFLYDESFMLNNIGERSYIYLTQKTNMIKGTYDQAAQTAKVSLETVMNMLRDCFRCYWYVNDAGKFKIEHVTYFLKGRSYQDVLASVDLTTYRDSLNKRPILQGQEEIEYDISDLTRKYTFAFADESFLPFTGVELNADAPYIEGDKIEDINLGSFSADVDYMQISPDSVSQDGFALLCPVYSKSPDSSVGSYSLPIREVQTVENGWPYTIAVQNALASWAELINYYAWDMPAYNVSANASSGFSVYGLKECKTQSIKAPNISGLLPYMSVNTQVGRARIVSVSENIDTGHLTLDLVYPFG